MVGNLFITLSARFFNAAGNFLYLESSRVTAFSAKLLCRFLAFEAVFHCFSSPATENFSQLGCENVTESYIALVVKTAGDYTSVAKYTEVIGKPITENVIAHLCCVCIRPGKAVRIFKVELVPKPYTARAYLLGSAESVKNQFPGFVVESFGDAAVP